MTNDFLDALGPPPHTFQTFDDSPARRKELARVLHGTLEQHRDELAALNKRGAGVFVCVNKTDGNGRRGVNVTALRALFVDSDTGPLADDIDPMITVSSAAGEHGYWLLAPGERIEDFTPAQEALARKLNTDPAVKDLPRVMRLPGFFHMKGDPFMVRCNIGDIGDRKTIAQVLESVGAVVRPVQTDTGQPLGAILAAADRDLLVARCRVYLKKVQPAIQGAGGDSGTFKAGAIGGDFGLTADEFWPLLMEWNRRCQPPWLESELREKMDNAYRYRSKPLGIKLANWAGSETQRKAKAAFLAQARRDTEADLANALIDTLRTSGAIVSTGALLYQYCDKAGAWKEIDYRIVQGIAQDFDGATVLDNGQPVELRLSKNRVRGTCDLMLTSRRILRPDYFLEPPPGLAFANGFVTAGADGVRLVAHDPAHRARTSMPYDYDPDNEAPRWLAFLRDLFDGDVDAEDKRRFLQEFLGACLCGLATQYTKCAVLVGESGAGKSTLLAAITDNLFPPDAIARVRPQDWGHGAYLARLNGRNINVVAETPTDKMHAADTFKAVVAGDTVQARPLYQDPFDMRPRAGHIFACNDLPTTGDYSDAFFDRFSVIRCNRKFRDTADQVRQDKLLSTLRDEAPGIMVWALHGAVRLFRNEAYTTPRSATVAKDEWRGDVDNVAAWIGDRVAFCGDGAPRVAAIVAYRNYKEWCSDNGRRQVASNTFGRRLARLDVPRGHSNGRYYYLSFRSEFDISD